MERLKREPQQKKAFIEAKRKHPHDFAKQAELIVTARRPAGLPERFQPLFMADNNTRDPLDFFHQYPIERQRRLQAEAEQRREQQRQVTEETQQKRRREMENGRKTVQKLKQDAEERKIDQFGNATKRMWENALPVPIHLKGIITPNETEKDDGTIVHRSQVGIKVSYSFKIETDNMEAIEDTREDAFGNGESYTRYEKAGTYMKTYTNELFFGIGYFTDWSQVAPEAQQSVSDVDLKKGVKAYFVESSFYTGEQRKIHVFPLAYPGSDQTFEEQLYESAEALSSENIRRTIFHIVTEKGERSEDPSSTGLVESIPANENENEKEINRHFQKGYELTGLGRHEEAIQMYDQVIKIDPNNISARAQKGYRLLILGRHEEAIQMYDQVIKIDPNNISARLEKGYALAGLGRYEEAIAAYNQYLKEGQDDKLYGQMDAFTITASFVRLAKVDALKKLGRNEEATQEYNRVFPS